MKTYNNFIVAKWEGLGEDLQKRYPSQTAYQDNYIKCYGFAEWLEDSQDSAPSVQMVISIAKTFKKHGRRDPTTIPMVLSSISRQYRIEMPAVYGILSPDYWIEKLENY